MPDLRDLIKHYPELGEHLAETENRLSTLENSVVVSGNELPVIKEPPEKIAVRGLTLKERQEFGQLKAQLKFVENKINQFVDSKKKRAEENKDKGLKRLVANNNTE